MKINIFASSDVHGFIDGFDYAKDNNCKNSLAAINNYINIYNDNNIILVDNGDMIQGNFIDNFIEYEKHPAISIMNYMSYDIWNLGNHEFNYGVKNLKNVIKQFKGETLMANSNDDFFTPYTIIERNNIKIGFIGINTPLINVFESKKALGDLEILNPIPVLEKALDNLSKKTDAIIGLFHLGLNDENAVLNSGLKSILNNLKNKEYLDAVVLGHTHQKIEKEIIDGVLVTQPFVYGKYLAHIELEFNGNKLVNKNSELIDISKYPLDKNITEFFKPYKEHIFSFTHEVLGYIENANEHVDVNLEDTPLAHLISDIMLSFKKADVTAFQIDNNDAVLKNGAIRRCDMANLYSYAGGEVSLYEITGLDLKRYMEWSAGYFDKINGKIVVNEKRGQLKYKTFDIFGNIKYLIDLDCERGKRIKNLKFMNGKEILDDEKLIIAVNEYRMNFLTSESGPLSDRSFTKIISSKYQDDNGKKHGTIRGDLAEKFFSSLKNKTYIVDNKKNFYIK